MRWLVTALLLGALATSPAALAAGKRVAVVVGVSDVPALPAEVQLQHARRDARSLARYFEDHAGYSTVHVLLDAVANREGVRRMLLETVPSTTGPGDTVVVAFVGHGFGGDFGDPHLAFHDFDPADPQSTGLRLETFVPELARTLDSVNMIILLDAAHTGEIDGLALRGPTAKTWPAMAGNVFMLSASSPGEVAPDGMFVPLLVAGLEGAADTNKDLDVTASELHRHLLLSMATATGDAVHPAEAGTYDANLVVGKAIPAAPRIDPTLQPLLPEPLPEGRGWGGPVSYSLMGMGAGFGVVGALAYRRGKSLCTGFTDSGSCILEANDQDTYEGIKKISSAGFGAGALFIATGFGLAFVPLEGGAGVFVQGAF